MEPVCGRGIEETSGTNGNGVHHCQRRPRGVLMLEHYSPLASWYGVRDLHHLQQVVTRPNLRVDVYTLTDLESLPHHREPVAVTHVKDDL